jgi:hypothetical protein
MLETIGNSEEKCKTLISMLLTQYPLLKFGVFYTEDQDAGDKLGLTS